MKIFSGFTSLERGLDAAWKRNSVIQNNVANVDTPGFKSSTVEFESLYKQAIDDDSFRMKRTRASHMNFSSSELPTAQIQKRPETDYRMDENNVDIDKEISDLAKNGIYANLLYSKASGLINQLSTAIR